MAEPIPLVAGRFTLYQTAKGGMHLSMMIDGEVEPRHAEIPAMMVKMLARKAKNVEQPDPNDGGDFVREVFTNGVVSSETVSIPDFLDDDSPDLGEDYGR